MSIVYHSFEMPNQHISPTTIKDVVIKAGLIGVYYCDTNVVYLREKISSFVSIAPLAVEIIFEEDDDAVEYILSRENYIYPNSDWVKFIYNKEQFIYNKEQWIQTK